MDATVLIVDDSVENLAILAELLQPHFRVRAVNSGERAIQAALSQPQPDLILLDVSMPDLGGFEVLTRLRRDFAPFDVPVIFVTANDGVEDEEKGLALGAVDYITKPFNPAVVLARVRTHLEMRRLRQQLASENERLEKDVMRRASETFLVTNLTVRTLASVAGVKDNSGSGHVSRTQAYVEILATHLSRRDEFRDQLSPETIDLVTRAAPLHDIGKVGVADAILLKAGRLTESEFEQMKAHTTIGASAIRRALDQTVGSRASDSRRASQAVALMTFAEAIARSHHERWDGTGYPQGLAGDTIPLAARLMAVADVVDALTHARPYRPALDFVMAAQIIREGRGTQFDPGVVDAFLVCQDQLAVAAQRFPDDPTAA